MTGMKSWNKISKGKAARQRKRDDAKAYDERLKAEAEARLIEARNPNRPRYSARALAVVALAFGAAAEVRSRG